MIGFGISIWHELGGSPSSVDVGGGSPPPAQSLSFDDPVNSMYIALLFEDF